ncbi:MAG TPA: antitoxin [Acidimicrobiales bacterium]|jgi:hypothetical protein|nr:antitoxin [Acidimicrobiales bacterium]
MSPKINVGKLAAKAKSVVDKSGDKIAAGVDKATNKIDTKTGGKYHAKLEKIDNLASKLDKTAKDEAAEGQAPAGEVATGEPAAAAPDAAIAPQPEPPVAGWTTPEPS